MINEQENNKIRILVITNCYPTEKNPGDTPCIKDQVSALGELGLQIDLLYINRERKINYFKAIEKVFRLNLSKNKYHLIHAYYGYCGLIALFQCKVPVVVTFRGSDLLSRKEQWLGRLIARLSDGVIVMNEEMKKISGRNDTEIIPFGVNTAIFKPYPLAQAREELHLSMKKKYVLFPYDPKRSEKRFDLINGAVKLLCTRGYDIEILIIFNQSRSIIAKYMNAANGMIIASDYEGSPMAVREALACGLPVISVDVGDIKNLISSIPHCYITKQDTEYIASTFEKVIVDNERIREKVLTKYNVEFYSRKVVDLYSKVLNKPVIIDNLGGEKTQ